MRDTLARAWPPLLRTFRHVWDVIWRAMVKYTETDGEQRAASFAYYAFFSIFPLILLLVSVGAMFVDDEQKAAEAVIKTVGNYIPVEPPRSDGAGEQALPVVGAAVGIARGIGQPNWFVNVVEGVIRKRQQAGLLAFGLLAWSAIRFFQSLVRGVNKAWGTKEYSWWRLPIKNLAMVGIVASALFLGVVAPSAIDFMEWYYWTTVGTDIMQVMRSFFWLSRKILPTLVLFYGFAMFYKFSPRRRTRFREIWLAAILVTLGLQVLQQLFVFYATNLGDFNRLYGTLASVVALLMWIYLSGSMIIFGGCLSAAQYEVDMHITDQSESSTARP
jgi:YihY family inner membrane protein